MVTVFVHGLETYAHHGVTDEEQKIGHRYLVDLEVDVESSAEATDCITDTVDYGAIASQVLDLMQSPHRRTLEHLAATVAEDILKTHLRVQAIRLSIAKKAPPAPIIAKDAGVRLARIRESR